MYIGIDFDGTVVKHRFPNIGEDIGAVPTLKDLVAKGHKLILYTMRGTIGDDTLTPAVKWFEDNGIELYGVNNNKTQYRWTNSPKVYCNLYIDDAALGCPCNIDEEGRNYVNWKKVNKILKTLKIL